LKNFKTIATALLAAALLASFAACGYLPERAGISSATEAVTTEAVTEPAPPVEQSYIFVNTLPELVVNNSFPTLVRRVREKHEQNEDTVGWLFIPGTTTNEEVLINDDPKDFNKFYERKGFDKLYSWQGVLYSDFRGKFGDGAKEDLLSNTVIYGHNLGPGYEDVKFGPLMRFSEEDFARTTPYVCFSTREEDLVWEVFSVFYVTVDLRYNVPDLAGEEFVEIVSESRARSLYNYETDVGAYDKIITMSTCCYYVPGIGMVEYPSDYRFVVMAKLIEKSDATKEEADFEVNPAPKEP
jgi:sortase B